MSGIGVTGGTSATPTLALGNVHVSAVNNGSFNINNTGTTGPVIRGAIQNSGVTTSGLNIAAQNFGPIGLGGSTVVNYSYTPTTGGALSGQTFNVVTNFDNVAGQTVGVTGTAYNFAAGSAIPTPVTIANQRIGGSNSTVLNVSNTSPSGSYTEGLDASFGANTGSVTNNGGTINQLSGQANNNTSMSVGVSTASAGAKSGTVNLNYTSDGTGTSGLGNTSVGSQSINVSGNVYQAAVGAIQTAPLNFGTVQVGQSVSENLVIRNTATGPSGFVEDLNASFGSTSGTGASLLSGTGSMTGILAGTNSSGSNGVMTVNVNTSAAGSVAGDIGVNFYTAGAVNGVSNGLGTALVGSENFGVNGTIQTTANVINQASPVVNSPTINLGAVRVGATAPTAYVSVTNQATTAPQAALDASISTNGAPVTAGGSFNLLTPGNTSANQLQVGLNTSIAGNYTGANVGSATIAFVSDANNVGGCGADCQMALASQNVQVTGKVYQQALAQVNTNTVNFGIVHVGDSVTAQNVSVTNSAPVVALNDVLTGSLSGASGPFTASGTLGSGLAAASTNTSSLSVSLNTNTAGNYAGLNAGSAIASFQSHNPDMADISLVSSVITLEAQVNNYANPVFNLLSGSGSMTNTGTVYDLNFGNVLQNSGTETAALQVMNDVSGPSDLVQGSFSSNNQEFALTGFNSFSGLAADGSVNGLSVAFSTSSLGQFDETITLNAEGYNASGYSENLPIELVVTGDIVGSQQSVPEPSTVLLLGTGLAGIIAARRKIKA